MDAFAALADPTRRRIIELLSPRERTSGDLARQFSISAPAISQHLKVLQAYGMVRVRRDAQRRVYAIDPRGFRELDRWIATHQRLWNRRLDKLAAALEEGPA